jgi:hypothetical protein
MKPTKWSQEKDNKGNPTWINGYNEINMNGLEMEMNEMDSINREDQKNRRKANPRIL